MEDMKKHIDELDGAISVKYLQLKDLTEKRDDAENEHMMIKE